MLSSRFFYYLLWVNAIVNTTIYVPVILIAHRENSALASILFAAVIGFLFLTSFNRVLKAFPGKGLPEMLSGVPVPIKYGILLLAAISWFWSGLTMILAYLEISSRYINPAAPDLFILLAFFMVVGPAVLMRSTSILYAVEIVLFVIAPFILFVFYKGLTSETLEWNGIFATLVHSSPMPDFQTVAAATFIFSGYANMIVFNRFFPSSFRIKHIWLIATAGLFLLLYTFLIPIGYLGTAAVGRYPFPWLATADSIRLEFFVVERLLFLFIPINIAISLLSTIIHWHVCLECLKAFFGSTSNRLSMRKRRIASYVAVGILFILTGVATKFADEFVVQRLNLLFLGVRLPEEFMLLGILVFLARRKKPA